METLWQDIRYSLRLLLQNRVFTLVALLALALGIGANTAIFSVVNSVLLNPLPYSDPDRLVMVWERDVRRGKDRDTPPPANYIDWRDQNRVFEQMAAYTNHSANLTGVGEPERLEGERVSASLFSILGVEAKSGRTFLPEEDTAGNSNVIMISDGLWQRRFGSDPGVVGKPISLNGVSYTVVGIMPPSFKFPNNQTQYWIPIAFSDQEKGARNSRYLQVVARLKPGITLQQAQAAMDGIGAQLAQQYPQSNTDVGVNVVSLHEQVVGDIRPALLVLLGGVAFVLLIACANVANLLLARSAVRFKEIAIRSALGATRLRIMRQLLTESSILGLAGGLMGILLALWAVDLLRTFSPQNLPRISEVRVDARVLGFTFLISILTGIIFGLVPALQLSKPDLTGTMKEGGRRSSGSHRNNFRRILVISEVALALVLLVGHGLMIRSFLQLQNTKLGFNPEGLLTMKMVLPDSKYAETPKRVAFYQQVLERVEALPGVESAGFITNLPLTVRGNSNSFFIENYETKEGEARPLALYRAINTNYFKTMKIALISGRYFEENDMGGTNPVIVINETAARRYWPNQDPIGKRIKYGRLESAAPWITIVGMVGDVRQVGIDAEPRPEIYVPYPIAFSIFMPTDLVVRTRSEPLSMAAAVKSEILAVDKDQPVSNVRTMEQICSESISQRSFNMVLLGLFAVIALTLAAVGLYGVMSYSVTQQTHEIGIRMALGAQRKDVLRLVLGQAVTLVLIGLVLGLVASFALTRLMTSLLYGVSATDPSTFVLISLLLLATALLASYIPARRAMKVDPMVALRYE